MNQTVLVWDSTKLPSIGYRKVFLWRSFDCESYPDAISMPKVVDDNAADLKNQYLKLIYYLGKKKLNGQSVIDYMQLRKGFNYWWLTLIVEKCNYAKSTWINEAIRLIAFEKIIKYETLSKIRLVTSNELLAESFRLLCIKYTIDLDWQKTPRVKTTESFSTRFYGSLPLSLQAIVSFVFNLIHNWSFKGVGLKEWKSTKGEITFFSYLFNLVPESAKKGYYESKYWAQLPDILFEEGISTNWLHLYIKNDVLPTTKKATELIQNFNQIGQGVQTHATLFTFLNWKVIKRLLLDWVSLLKAGKKIKGIYSLEINNENYLWPFIKIDLKESIYGRVALNNLLYFNLFEEALRLLPNQKKGIYLQENQGWEFGLIQAWKTAEYGELIGVPHSTVRYWDLRYYFDYRSYNGDESKQIPRPDIVAVNGNLMRKSYLDGGYNRTKLVNVEALRYLYLNTNSEYTDNSLHNGFTVILVLGEYLAKNTHYQMCILEAAFPSFSSNIKLLVKPHPNCPIIPSDYPNIKMEVTMDSISSLLPKCNIAYTSNVTSAAIDAYCADLPVISYLNPQSLNMSPLMGVEGVKFVSRADELVNAIKNIKNNHYNKNDLEDIFWLDSDLLRWKKLLSS